MNHIYSLDHLPIGMAGTVLSLRSEGKERRRMLDLGLVHGTKIEALQKSPSGDPVAYFIRGAVIALRMEDARKIVVQHIPSYCRYHVPESPRFHSLPKQELLQNIQIESLEDHQWV